MGGKKGAKTKKRERMSVFWVNGDTKCDGGISKAKKRNIQLSAKKDHS